MDSPFGSLVSMVIQFIEVYVYASKLVSPLGMKSWKNDDEMVSRSEHHYSTHKNQASMDSFCTRS